MTVRLARLVLADVRQRTRSNRFLAVVAGAAYVGFLVTGGTVSLTFGDRYAAVRNDAWLGVIGAMTAATLVWLVGFFVVKNALDVDRRTDAAALVAAAPVSSRRYLLAKYLGNVVILGGLVAVIAVAATLTSAVAGTGIPSLPAVGLPTLLLPMPVVLVVAAAALLFETLTPLRGTVGNVLYLLLATTSLAGLVLATTLGGSGLSVLRPVDPLGFGIVAPEMTEALHAAYPDYAGTSLSFGITDVDALRRFPWSGVDWTVPRVLGRLAVAAPTLPLLALAALSFDRFRGTGGWSRPRLPADVRRFLPVPGGAGAPADESRSGPRRGDDRTGDGAPEDPPSLAGAHRPARGEADLAGASLLARETGAGDVDTTAPAAGPAAQATDRSRFPAVLAGELRLALRGRATWWYAGLVALVGAGALAPPATGRRVVLPVAVVWGLPVLSSLGVRPVRHGVAPLLRSSPGPLLQVLAAWLAGLAVSGLAVAGVVGRLAGAGALGPAAAAAIGAVFVPSLALGAGSLARSGRLFELLLLCLWYLGPLNGLPAVDFAGVGDAALAAGTPLATALASGGLVGVGLAVRWTRLRR